MSRLISIDTISVACECTKRSSERRAKDSDWPYVEKSARGGKKRWYKIADLPDDVQVKVVLHLVKTSQMTLTDNPLKGQEAESESKPKKTAYNREDLWAWHESRPESTRNEAMARAELCQRVRVLVETGVFRSARSAIPSVAKDADVPEGNLRRWWYGTASTLGAANVDPSDYIAALTPRHKGCVIQSEFTHEAWEFIKWDWLRPEQPAVAAVYRRAKTAAKERGWVIPSLATVSRKLKALPWYVQVLGREGQDALERRMPHITRVKSWMHALQAVNADGHTFDVRVVMPSGEVGRPVLVAWQDIYSGKMLAYRVGETLNQHIVRLSFGDLVEDFGIPEDIYLDNGREFANKWLTGQTKTRYRFAIKEDDPEGVFKLLGSEVHWTTPYHGQSKPIERAFLDLCENISRHPMCSGAYTGNSPMNKPSNYGEKAMDYDAFLRIVEQGIAEHNARTGRRSEVANGRSFDETFEASYAKSSIRKATAEQRRLWLLASDAITVRENGHIEVMKNLYWGECMGEYVGKKVVARFDSDNLQAPVHIYTLGGEYIGEAECKRANFNDAQAAKDHARANRHLKKAYKEQLKAERTMSNIEAVQMLPDVVVPMERPKSKIIEPVFGAMPKVANGYDHDDEGGLRPGEQHMLSIMHTLPRRTDEDEY